MHYQAYALAGLDRRSGPGIPAGSPLNLKLLDIEWFNGNVTLIWTRGLPHVSLEEPPGVSAAWFLAGCLVLRGLVAGHSLQDTAEQKERHVLS
jgi:hypothetical protein